MTSGAGDPMIGRELEGRYRIVDVLGTGGVGVVYRAERLPSGGQVAIKLLHPENATNESLRQRFEREATALAEVAHPHIVPLSDYGISEDTPFIVMELLEGETLEALLRREHTVAPDRALTVVSQMLSGLAFAHSQGLIHRDLKPGNIFLQKIPSGAIHVRILDFGLAKFVAGARSSGPVLTKTGSVFGTPAYMAPEQAVAGEMDASTDVYAVGVMLFEMLAGAQPFVGKPYEIARAHLVAPIPSLSEKRSDVAATPALTQLFERAMAKEQGDRFRNAGEMLAAVRGLPVPPIVAVRGAADVWQRASHDDVDSRPPRAKSSAWVLWALVVAALIAGGVFFLTQR